MEQLLLPASNAAPFTEPNAHRELDVTRYAHNSTTARRSSIEWYPVRADTVNAGVRSELVAFAFRYSNNGLFTRMKGSPYTPLTDETWE